MNACRISLLLAGSPFDLASSGDEQGEAAKALAELRKILVLHLEGLRNLRTAESERGIAGPPKQY